MVIYANIPKITKIASPSFLDRFSFCLFYLIGLGGASKLVHNILKFINYANLCKFIQSTKMLRTSFLNPFWFMQQIYANLFKITKNTSSFLNWFLFGLLYLIELSLVRQASTQNLEFILAAFVNCNLCKLIQKKKCFFSLISWPILILFALSDRANGGGNILKICLQITNKLLLLLHFSTNFYSVCFIW